MTTYSSYIVLSTLKFLNSDDIILARQRARQITELLKFDTHSQTKIVTVISEICRNACLYAGGGKIEYCLSKNPLHRTFIVRINDKGPGIPHLIDILAGKHPVGLGIIGSKRIMDHFRVSSSPQQGTEVIAEMDFPTTTPLITPAILAKISEVLAKNRLRTVSEEVEKQNQELLQALALLSESRDALERRVEERTVQLAVANQKLQQEIIDRKRMEEWAQIHQKDLSRVERMNCMGELASILAHELNQPLTAISAYTQGSIRRLENIENAATEGILEVMKLVVKQSQRAGEIIHRMKNFMRQGELVKEKADIHQVIQETIILLQREIEKSHVLIQFELGEIFSPVYIDIIQIQQAITNLIRNALQALDQNKTLKPYIIIKTSLLNKSTIKVEIIDNGPGISQEDLELISKPYFTTKKEGMGIGLSITRTVIEAHEGILSAKNNSQGGACFGMTLKIFRGKK